jgi:hypothetical protein
MNALTACQEMAGSANNCSQPWAWAKNHRTIWIRGLAPSSCGPLASYKTTFSGYSAGFVECFL